MVLAPRTVPAEQRRFLVLHGYTNRRPEGHWQRRLTTALRDAGEQVVYPALPDTDDPRLEDWLEVLGTELELLGDPATVERVVVAHSLGAVLWLHAAARGLEAPVDRVLLVAPPGPAETAESIPRFVLPDGLDAAAVAAAARSTLLVCSDADPWCAGGQVAAYAEPLGLRSVVIPGAAHLALGDGFGPWPEVVAWALDPASVWV
jgi:predicted alpha/beta hydrolase family esterase